MTNKINLSNIIYIITLFLIDVLVMIFSLKIAIYLRTYFNFDYLPNFSNSDISKYYWIIFITSLIIIFEKIYFIRYDFWSDTKRVYKALILSFVAVLTVITLTKMSNDYSRAFLTLFYMIMFLLLPFSKRLLKRILFKFDFFKQKIKVIGNSSLVEKMKNEIDKNWYFGYQETNKKYEIVIIISKNMTVEYLQKVIKRYSKFTRNIYVVPYMHHLDFTHTNVVDYFNIRLSAIHIENRLLNYKNLFIKYIFEKFLVIVLFPFALILHMFVSILIKIDSKGAIFFKQKRFGKKGKTFSCYKYRSMYINGNEILKEYLLKNPDEVEYYKIYHKYQKDPRITRVGRFLRATSLDEFPQFFNILRGDMNLIGPRPYMLNEQEKIGKSNENVILEVKPGITGLWQVSGRNNLTFDERVELDKWYIQNWSLWMDFVIFMKTIKVVLGKVGAK
jgi:lipopolysaccharide/colanic/teichoic acid biosynthesis glycosyltransferase